MQLKNLNNLLQTMVLPLNTENQLVDMQKVTYIESDLLSGLFVYLILLIINQLK